MYLSPVRQNNRLDDGKADAVSAGLRVAGGVGAVEAVKQILQAFPCDLLSCVFASAWKDRTSSSANPDRENSRVCSCF